MKLADDEQKEIADISDVFRLAQLLRSWLSLGAVAAQSMGNKPFALHVQTGSVGQILQKQAAMSTTIIQKFGVYSLQTSSRYSGPCGSCLICRASLFLWDAVRVGNTSKQDDHSSNHPMNPNELSAVTRWPMAITCYDLRRGYTAFVHAKLARILGASSVLLETKALRTWPSDHPCFPLPRHRVVRSTCTVGVPEEGRNVAVSSTWQVEETTTMSTSEKQAVPSCNDSYCNFKCHVRATFC